MEEENKREASRQEKLVGTMR